MSNTVFPDDFLWGAATAAYQIEGSPLADGAADVTITAKVKAALAGDDQLSALSINVDTTHAVVTLTGPAPTQAALERATGLAKAVATLHAIGLDEPSDLGMIAIGVLGVILGRQSGLFMSRHKDPRAG